MKKKILSLILCLMMCLSVFAGCNLVTRNDQKYYEAIVCTIDYKDGTQDAITKRDLLMGYNSYGYNYVQNYGYTQEQAINATLETIINQHLTIKAVEEYYDKLNDGIEVSDEKFQPLLNGSETTYLYDTTYNAIYDNLKSYFSEIVGVSNGEASEENTSSVFEPYQQQAYLEEVDGKLVIKKKTTATTIRETYEVRKLGDEQTGEVYDFENQTFKELMYNKILSFTTGNDTSAKNWKSALNKYISDVKSNYSYKNFASDKDCFMFELDRVYKILKDNYIVEKYETIFNFEAHQDADVANVTVNDILKLYTSKVMADYTDYVINGNVSNFETNILSEPGSVDYIMEGTGTDYFNVAYLKVEVDSSAISNIQNSAYLTEEEKRVEIEKIYNDAKATIRDEKTGEATGEIDVQLLLNQIREDVADAGEYVGNPTSDKMTARDKAEAFRKYFYLYNDDDTYKGTDYNAVFGVKNNGEVLLNSALSGNTAVEDAIRSLYAQGNAKVGDTSEIVRTDDALYIFFYAGKLENLFAVNANFDATTREENIKILASTRVNIFSEKKIFDSLYETLTTDNFSVFQNMNMQNLRSTLVVENGIKADGNNLKDLYLLEKS